MNLSQEFKSNNKYLPLVSIGLPVFNGEKYLKESLLSLLKQDYTNIELIISDNASSDKTFSICQKYAKKNKRILYFRQKYNIGAHNNFHYVLTKAKGKYFMWASHDDLWDKNYIKKLVKTLEIHPEFDIVAANYFFFSDKSRSVRTITCPSFKNNVRIKSILTFLYNRSKICDVLNYGLFRTNKLKLLGGRITDTRRKYLCNLNQDIYALFYLLINGICFYIYPEHLFFKRDSAIDLDVYYEIEEGNITSDMIKKIIRYFFIFPLVIIYDHISFFMLIIKSKYSLNEKNIITLYLFRKTLLDFLWHYYSIVKGTSYFIKGLWARIFCKRFFH